VLVRRAESSGHTKVRPMLGGFGVRREFGTHSGYSAGGWFRSGRLFVFGLSDLAGYFGVFRLARRFWDLREVLVFGAGFPGCGSSGRVRGVFMIGSRVRVCVGSRLGSPRTRHSGQFRTRAEFQTFATGETVSSSGQVSKCQRSRVHTPERFFCKVCEVPGMAA